MLCQLLCQLVELCLACLLLHLQGLDAGPPVQDRVQLGQSGGIAGNVNGLFAVFIFRVNVAVLPEQQRNDLLVSGKRSHLFRTHDCQVRPLRSMRKFRPIRKPKNMRVIST